MRSAFIAAVFAAVLGSVSAFVAPAAPKETFEGDVVFRIPYETKTYKKLTAALHDPSLGLDFWGSVANQHTDVRVPSYSLAKFRHLAPNAEVLIENLGDLVAQEAENSFAAASADADFFSDYRKIDEINTFLSDLTLARSDIATSITIGTTFEKRKINGVRLVGKGGPTKKKGLVFHGGQHAREWISVAVTSYLLNEFSTKYGTDSEVTNILDNFEITVIPVLNVDGYVYTHTTNRLWRKNRQTDSSSSCIGVDPNRNWGYLWASGGSSSDPCNDAFHGRSAFSAAEPVAVRDYINERGNVVGYIDFHAYAQYWMTPFGATCSLPAAYTKQKAAGDAAAAALKAVAGTKFDVGSVCNIIYQASGSSCDYTYAVQNVTYSYGVELRDTGKYGFLLPAAQIVPSGQETFAAIKALAKYILAN